MALSRIIMGLLYLLLQCSRTRATKFVSDLDWRLFGTSLIASSVYPSRFTDCKNISKVERIVKVNGVFKSTYIYVSRPTNLHGAMT